MTACSPNIAENPPVARSPQPLSDTNEKKEIDQSQISKDVDGPFTVEEAVYRKKMFIKKTND